ncbi:MAG TPA: AAA family ATPase [Rhizobiaceae bacterium]|nr:AAA family ATPase [Rhizobiaceae bacterium]
MNEANFKEWLTTNYRPNTVSTKLSECRNLAAAYGNLDEHFDADRLESVMLSLAYSADDRANNRPNPSKLNLTSHLYRNLSNYRTAINYYRNFRDGASRRSGGGQRPDSQAVNRTMDEFDKLGLEAFLEAYNFGSSFSYWVVRDGKRYPSKAIFGVAHQYMPNGAPLDNEECSGSDARKHLAKLGFEIQGDESPRVTEDRPRRFWIEKTIVSGRADRMSGDNALGRSLWSPQRSKDGKNIYAAMLDVRDGDVVFHLTDNNAISSVSLAAAAADASFIGLDGSDWASQPAFRVELSDHEQLSPPLARDAFLKTEPFAAELRELAESGAKGLFYNSRLELNQGAYLTEATPTLLSILNRAYVELAGRGLPFVDDGIPAERQERSDRAYTLDDALQELFLTREEAEEILTLWEAKKNIILQGPPGVGKSFAAHKLAFALMSAEERDRVGFVQFHQSYSYEDFVEGFRPTESGFELKAGKFVEFCRRAEADPANRYVFVIDEINRGNLSKILGELMLLIEADKRDLKWAMPLASGKAPFHVPANVYIMGLMNTADRSLAVVDYALRRRFAFVNLVPKLESEKFREHLQALGVGESLQVSLRSVVGELNAEIVADTLNLGPGFAIGHSFFCAGPTSSESDQDWYVRVVRTELVPLLQEYWFDAPEKADGWKERLLAGR